MTSIFKSLKTKIMTLLMAVLIAGNVNAQVVMGINFTELGELVTAGLTLITTTVEGVIPVILAIVPLMLVIGIVTLLLSIFFIFPGMIKGLVSGVTKKMKL